MYVGASVAHVNNAVMADGKLGAKLLQNGHFAVASGNAFDGLNLAGGWVITETRSVNVIRGDNSFERRLDNFLRRRRNHVKREVMPVQIVQQARKLADGLLQANALSTFRQVVLSDPPEFGIVQQQVGQFAALLHKMDVRESSDLFLKAGDAEHLGENNSRIIEAQRLIEITD